MSKIQELNAIGQAIWIDYIRRNFIENGELAAWVEKGVRGVTSNPAIFEKAIAHSSDYDEQLEALVKEGKSVDEIYDALAIRDIQNAADVFLPVYTESQGVDGYISLEVNPHLANDAAGTITEARRYVAAVNRPNLMIKVPATPAGVEAVEQLISEGINVNVTLMFSMTHYENVAFAYINGLEKFAANGGDLSKVNSVASFFISRVDSNLDPRVREAGKPELAGKIGVANSKAVYQRFTEIFSGDRWEALASKGARVQRPLWASTSTKDPSYPDTLYVDTLIGKDTVNTLPLETLDAFLDHGTAADTVGADMEETYAQLDALAALGIDLEQVAEDLQEEGLEKFNQPFDSLLAAIASRRDALLAQQNPVSGALGGAQPAIEATLQQLETDNIIARIWEGDHTVWSESTDEITNRLGWLDIADRLRQDLSAVDALVEAVRAEGYTDALLLGMGGSSLAPEVFSKVFGTADGYLNLGVLDSTDPAAVRAYAEKLDPAKTLYIVSTKSGGTVETLSFFKYFYNQVAAVDSENVGAHFVAITDPGSKLEKLAADYNFRQTFLNDANIGGRYSALSYFGLVPAALLGVDIAKLLDRAIDFAAKTKGANSAENPAAWLGGVIGALAQAGRDKLTLVTPSQIASFSDWVEQLIAESTGKNGKGVLPVVGEVVGAPDVYGGDRVFVSLELAGKANTGVDALEAAGHPVIRVALNDVYDLGGQFFLWELAVAVSGHVLGIQPFDQPNVESAKVQAQKLVQAYAESGALPEKTALLTEDGVSVYGDVSAESLAAALSAFLGQAQAGDYISLHAYIPPTAANDTLLGRVQQQLRDTHKLAVTIGYGPRFLHSTGQLHKGDGGNGLFIQFTADAAQDEAIPTEAGKDDSDISFNVLELAQALGDGEALLQNQRRLLRLHLGTDASAGLQSVLAAL